MLKDMSNMLPLEEALAILLEGVEALPAEQVPLRDALGRALAQDVVSDIDMPPFNKAAMDGYACRRADLGGELSVVETIQAGTPPTREVGPGECARIMTGAAVPAGADCVAMVEQTEEPAPGRMCFTGEGTADNICPRGEDMRVGDAVLRRGMVVGPQEVAMLASVGCVRVPVTRRARVGILSTGDELVEPEERPAPGQIRTSNSAQLCAQALRAGAQPTYYGIARDTEADLGRRLGQALAENDVVLVSGGVSMGDFDLVPGIMRAHGLDIRFDAVAMKPGKPTTFGRKPGKYCLGLPGNPVSSFVQFELLARPLLAKLAGAAWRPLEVTLPLRREVTRRGLDRALWLPVQLKGDGFVTRTFHGSAHVGSVCGADGLVCIPIGVDTVAAGTPMRVRLFGCG